MQWAVAKNFHLDAEKYQTATEEINAMLHMVHLGTHLKMVQFEALGESIAKTLTEILVKDRRALIGAHIRFAFKNFESSHPIQLVFVNAAVQDRIEFKNNGESQNEGMAKRGERAVDYPNAAHRFVRFCLCSYDSSKAELFGTRGQIEKFMKRAF